MGPIFSLDVELTEKRHNLIFARNGTGKSFLSRAFRYLDLESQKKDISDAAQNLISDESTDGKGEFLFSRGTNIMGKLELEKSQNNVSADVNDTIFHVFSEDFVHHELRQQEYNIDGKIENQISVDSDKIKQTEAQEYLDTAIKKMEIAASALRTKYDSSKLKELNTKAGINKQLREYKSLSLESLMERFDQKPDTLTQSFTDILNDLDRLKAIPAEPAYPEVLDSIRNNDIDLTEIETSLQKLTSPSSVSEEIKKNIDNYHSFYKTGVKIIQDDDLSTCPLCNQGITDHAPKEIIDAYINYFKAEEEKHKSELRELLKKLNQKSQELKDFENLLVRQKSQYDTLKLFVPSKKNTIIEDGGSSFKQAQETIISFKAVVEEKANTLQNPYTLPNNDFDTHIEGINKIIEENNAKVSELNKAVKKSDDERKTLQRSACMVFDHEFAINNWTEIETIRELNKDITSKQAKLRELEKLSPSTDARIRVADTFELLLKGFFAEKYVFDKENFILKRGEHEMVRGAHRTLSDGEKTAIAFCYFIACIHRKVTSNSDYAKLFIVFDDPVTSMSYDFVFSIAQTLKYLSISNNGDVSSKPSKNDNNGYFRPNFLILTHSSYFFNISRTNRVVNENATFSLSAEEKLHKILPLHCYVAPFEQQLKHVYDVSKDINNLDFGTGNAIRSVLEAVGRFCRPDKSQSLEIFIKYLTKHEDFSIKSTMINHLCHGTYYDETPSPDDIQIACQETVGIVEYFAPGQIKIIK